MDDPNITMKEYIRLKEEKAHKCEKVFNWETAKYGRIWYDEDGHNLKSIENELPAIAFNDSLKSGETLSCETTVSSLNDEIDFKISFDDSHDEDYMVTFDKNSFSYKIIYVNNLKTDSENDNEKDNMPSFPPPEPTVSCIDDLDFFKDFENEFPAIVYNNAQTSKSDLLTEPILSPQHINEFDLNDETSLSEYDEEEQNVLYFNDLFHMALPPCDQRHQYLMYEGLQYTYTDIVDFETRLARIYQREVHMVQVSDIGGLPDLMVKGLSARMLMEHRDAHGIEISSARDFLGITPSYTSIRDPILRPCHRSIACNIAQRSQAHEKVTDLFYLRRMDVGSVNVPYLLARYLRLFALGRNHGVMISRGKLVRLLICKEIDNTWAWVALGPERQPDAAASAHGVVQDAPVVDEGDRVISAPVLVPLPSPVSARTMSKRMARLEEDVHEIRGALAEQREVISAMARDFSRFTIWAANGIAQLLDFARVTYTSYSKNRIPYQHRVRQRTSEASTFTAQQDQQQPDP
ncbi:hypothetical protein Tco_0302619 [Tanacetum coccineum]